MSDVFFSVIIPVYNTEKYIDKCIQSVLQQSYKGYEIILVDDSSDDASGRVCQAYAEKYACISFYRMTHSGAGAVRNRGVLEASGKYVLFLDSDDFWRDLKLLETLFRAIQEENTDIIMFQLVKTSENGNVLKRFKDKPFSDENQVFRIDDIYPALVRDGQTLASACNKCVSMMVLKENNIKFLEGVFAEDIDWALQLFSVAKTIRVLNIRAYAYRQRKHGSASRDISGPNDQTRMIKHWANKLEQGDVPNKEAVAGVLAFEYAISMGYDHCLSPEMKEVMRENQRLLYNGIDRKTKLIQKVHGFWGIV